MLSDQHETLPRLLKLKLLNVDLSYSLAEHAAIASELQNALTKRNNINGAPALHLVFDHCVLSQAQLQSLQEVSSGIIELLGEPDA